MHDYTLFDYNRTVPLDLEVAVVQKRNSTGVSQALVRTVAKMPISMYTGW
jgi:hypothetical protein